MTLLAGADAAGCAACPCACTAAEGIAWTGASTAADCKAQAEAALAVGAAGGRDAARDAVLVSCARDATAPPWALAQAPPGAEESVMWCLAAGALVIVVPAVPGPLELLPTCSRPETIRLSGTGPLPLYCPPSSSCEALHAQGRVAKDQTGRQGRAGSACPVCHKHTPLPDNLQGRRHNFTTKTTVLPHQLPTHRHLRLQRLAQLLKLLCPSLLPVLPSNFLTLAIAAISCHSTSSFFCISCLFTATCASKDFSSCSTLSVACCRAAACCAILSLRPPTCFSAACSCTWTHMPVVGRVTW